MSYLDVLKPRLKEEESVRNKMYKDPIGINTIGCGHNCEAHPLPSDMQILLERNGYIKDEMIDALSRHNTLYPPRNSLFSIPHYAAKSSFDRQAHFALNSIRKKTNAYQAARLS